jgi:Zn-finger nucleic acid-binding protein
VRLVACPACKTHLDVTGVERGAVDCPCGTSVATVVQEGRDDTVRRCSGCGASLDERAPVCGYCQSPIVREPQRLTLVCPECLVRNPETGKFCTGCGTEFLAQAPLAERAPKPCPACEQPLVSQRIRDVWLLACSGCDGLWVPAASFDVLVKRTVAAEPEASDGLAAGRRRPAPGFDTSVVYRRCPDCRQRMVRKNFGRTSGLIVDWCGNHGTWFDADELPRVAAFVAAGGLEQDAPAEPASDEVRIVLERSAQDDASPWASLFEKLFNAGR